MDLSKVKQSIAKIKNIKLVFKKFKEILKLPYAKTYFFSSIILIVIFTIFTFPYDVVILNGIKSLEKSAVKSASVETIDYNMIGASTFSGLHFVLRNNDELKIDEISASPLSPLSTYISKKLTTDLQINSLKLKTKKASISLNLSSTIDLELDEKSFQAKNGTLNITIQSLKVKLINVDIPEQISSLITIPDKFSFRSIKLISEIKNKNLVLKNSKILGKELKGSISGTISMRTMFKNSRLRLLLKISSESKLLKKIKPLIESAKFLQPDGNIHIKITGSVARPKVRPQKNNSNPDNSKMSKKIDKIKNRIKGIGKKPRGRFKKGFEEVRDPRSKGPF